MILVAGGTREPQGPDPCVVRLELWTATDILGLATRIRDANGAIRLLLRRAPV
jgi:hypothetical protein